MRELVKSLPAASRPLLDPAGPKFRVDAANDAITLFLPPPHAALHAHNTGHWSKKRILVQALRDRVKRIAMKATDRKWPAATIEYRFFFPDAIQRDEANAVHSQKPAIDGIVDSGLIPNDDYQHLHTIGICCAVDKNNPRTELVLRRVAIDQ